MFVTTSMPNARKNKPPRNSQAVPTPKTAVIRNIRANESQAVAHVGVLPRRARGCADGLDLHAGQSGLDRGEGGITIM